MEHIWSRRTSIWVLLIAVQAACPFKIAVAQVASAGVVSGSSSNSNSSTNEPLSEQLLQKYLSNDELAAWGDEFTSKCSGIARKFSIGKSAGGADLWMLELSDKPGVDEPEPRFRYIANMHGDEPSGRMLLPMLAEWLCANNGKDDRATRLVRDTHLFLMPTMNPDGFAARRRVNMRGVDLNRNFPDPIFQKGADLREPLGTAAPETKAVMAFTLERSLTASANLHEGAIVANYPWDGYPDKRYESDGRRNPTPDDVTFEFLAKQYASHHAFMSKSREFPGGIVNGAMWYPVYHGMQDWNYVAGGCMAITLELSESKWRPEGDLRALWEENRNALLALAAGAALGGVRGRVKAAGSGAPLAARLHVKNLAGGSGGGGGGQQVDPLPFYSGRAFGEYARPLAPGRHVVTATAEGYQPAEAEVEVPEGGAGAVLDFELKPVAGSSTSSIGGGADSSSGTSSETTTTSSSSSDGVGGGGGSGLNDTAVTVKSGEAGTRGGARVSLHVILIHVAVFAAIAGASWCHGSAAARAVGGSAVQALGGAAASQMRRVASHPRFEA